MARRPYEFGDTGTDLEVLELIEAGIQPEQVSGYSMSINVAGERSVMLQIMIGEKEQGPPASPPPRRPSIPPGQQGR